MSKSSFFLCSSFCHNSNGQTTASLRGFIENPFEPAWNKNSSFASKKPFQAQANHARKIDRNKFRILTRVFPKNRGIPKWMMKIMENPIKMDDLGGKKHLFLVQHPHFTLLKYLLYTLGKTNLLGFFRDDDFGSQKTYGLWKKNSKNQPKDFFSGVQQPATSLWAYLNHLHFSKMFVLPRCCGVDRNGGLTGATLTPEKTSENGALDALMVKTFANCYRYPPEI